MFRTKPKSSHGATGTDAPDKGMKLTGPHRQGNRGPCSPCPAFGARSEVSWHVHWLPGVVAGFCGLLVAVSTFFSKQHHVLDVIAGMFLASVAYALFLRVRRRDQVPEQDRQVASVMAFAAAEIVGTATPFPWAACRLNVS